MIKTKSYILFIGLLIGTLTLVAEELAAGNKAYAIRDGTVLHSEKDPESSPLETLRSHHAYSIVEISGKWVKLKTASHTGWVYLTNLSSEEPPEINTSTMHTTVDDTTRAAGYRGLGDEARHYANEQGKEASIQQLEWMEKANAAVSDEDVTDYMKSHHLGEYQK